MNSVSVNGVNLAYSIDGKGESLVFIHGLGLDRRVWSDQIRHFSASYETLAYDLRGHGQSDAPGTGYSYADHVNDLAGIVDDCASYPVHLVGQSMGGAIAFQYARKNPENVASLTLAGTHICGYTAFDSWPNLYKIAKRDGIQAARDTWKGFRLFSTLKSDESKVGLLERMVDEFSCAPWTDPNPRYDDDDDFSAVGELVLPTLIVSGTLDPDFRPISESLALELPDVRFESFNCGHLVNFELPDEFNDALAAFLREIL
jgi:3-oxoadipate enol-lactonase